MKKSPFLNRFFTIEIEFSHKNYSFEAARLSWQDLRAVPELLVLSIYLSDNKNNIVIVLLGFVLVSRSSQNSRPSEVWINRSTLEVSGQLEPPLQGLTNGRKESLASHSYALFAGTDVCMEIAGI